MPIREHASIALAISILIIAFAVALGFGHEFVRVGGARFWHSADDHMITQRVAYNFHMFGLPYFNREEAVSANTSLFWPLALSTIYGFLSLELAIPAVIALSAAMWAATVALAALAAPSRLAAVAVAALLILSPTAFTYAATGWEHVPQTLLVTLAFVVVLVRSDRKGVLDVPFVSVIAASGAFLLRPDSAVGVAILCLAWLACERRWARPACYAALGALAALPFAYLFLMHAYYGALTPNTAHLKVGFSLRSLGDGLAYVASIRHAGIVPAFLLVGLLGWRRLRPAERLCFVAIAAQLVYVVAVGGDYFLHGRFLMLYLPVATVLAVRLVARVAEERALRQQAALGLVVLLVVAGQNARSYVRSALTDTPFQMKEPMIACQIAVLSTASRVVGPEDGSIGLHFLGIGYHFPDYHVVDFLGKAEATIARTAPHDAAIAHRKWDYDYAFSTYDIALVPVLGAAYADVAEGRTEAGGWEHWYWKEAVARMLALGYGYLSPADLGLEGVRDCGLFVRPDLLERFRGPEWRGGGDPGRSSGLRPSRRQG